LFSEGFRGGDYGIAVDGDRILHAPSVATRKSHHHWNVTSLRHAKHEFIAALQALNG
jgi:hypothetical protein